MPGGVDSFMRDRQVIMSVDGQESAPLEIITGLPQGSPISPVLFAVYVADIRQLKARLRTAEEFRLWTTSPGWLREWT